MRFTGFAAVRPANKVLHIVPDGNSHARCGVVAEHGVNGMIAGKSIVEGLHTVCKNCGRVKPPRDHNADTSEITDTWSVTNKAGHEVARVHGNTMERAADKARDMATVRRVSYAEGGFSLRRMRRNELKAAMAVDTLAESTLPTITLHTVLHRQTGLHVEGRRAICAALAARGITVARVRALNT